MVHAIGFSTERQHWCCPSPGPFPLGYVSPHVLQHITDFFRSQSLWHEPHLRQKTPWLVLHTWQETSHIKWWLPGWFLPIKTIVAWATPKTQKQATSHITWWLPSLQMDSSNKPPMHGGFRHAEITCNTKNILLRIIANYLSRLITRGHYSTKGACVLPWCMRKAFPVYDLTRGVSV